MILNNFITRIERSLVILRDFIQLVDRSLHYNSSFSASIHYGGSDLLIALFALGWWVKIFSIGIIRIAKPLMKPLKKLLFLFSRNYGCHWLSSGYAALIKWYFPFTNLDWRIAKLKKYMSFLTTAIAFAQNFFSIGFYVDLRKKLVWPKKNVSSQKCEVYGSYSNICISNMCLLRTSIFLAFC